jgi:hypothetical protein
MNIPENVFQVMAIGETRLFERQVEIDTARSTCER